MPDVIILKTALLYEADMLVNALEEAGVPHYREQSNFSGLREAMPAIPTQGPGNFFSVIVPEIAAEEARALLDSLPIIADSNPGIWRHKPRPWAKKVLITAAFMALAGYALQVLFTVFGMWN